MKPFAWGGFKNSMQKGVKGPISGFALRNLKQY
jgi:hypothetical protein